MYWRYAEIRNAKGKTDSEVSAATGISQSVLSNWKNRQGQKYLSLENMCKIAKCLEVPIDALMEGGEK